MPNYTKLFNSIITSTIWSEDDKTRIIWITMLAMSDKNGEVHASIPGLARVASMTIGDAESAIEKLMSPDPYSRTPDNEGRRIAKIDGGWELLNHGKYRLMASKEDEKAATAERVRRHRNRNAGVTQCNGHVTQCNGHVTVGRDIAEAEAEAEADTKTKNTPLPPKGDGDTDENQIHILPKNWQKLSATEKKQTKVNTNSKAMNRIGRFFGRREGTLWSVAEAVAIKTVSPPPDEIQMVEAYYLANIEKESDYRRKDLLTLLNNWSGEVDRSRIFIAERGIKLKPQPTPCQPE